MEVFVIDTAYNSIHLIVLAKGFKGEFSESSTSKELRQDSCRRRETVDPPSVADINTVRYFRCPATVPVSVLKSLVKTKYRIPEALRVELLYGEERLLDSWTLMEVAYIFQWKRESPMELSFQVLVVKKIKRKRLKIVKRKKESNRSRRDPLGNYPRQRNSDSHSQEPPLKIPRLEDTSSVPSSVDEHHPRPPTPPETPDGPADMNSETDPQQEYLSKSEADIKGEESFTSSPKCMSIRIEQKKSSFDFSEKSKPTIEEGSLKEENCDSINTTEEQSSEVANTDDFFTDKETHETKILANSMEKSDNSNIHSPRGRGRGRRRRGRGGGRRR
ncbi:Polycomb complex protein BMI-1 [Armadillidium nasatum]|uniref:Polycomb complex protein BMI-1 n=1 Tax=Armadillidium nasatum TaxID=96803 RepID=A0A5N5T5H7_9CRUS|nr:Polycomb complex protein BMI-1 [Armadillidium nasatum]